MRDIFDIKLKKELLKIKGVKGSLGRRSNGSGFWSDIPDPNEVCARTEKMLD